MRKLWGGLLAGAVALLGVGVFGTQRVFSANAGPDAAYVKECSACHIAFPAQYLPKRSWERILGMLDKHFGENATLSPAALAPIKAYLDAHAADSAMGNPRTLRDVPATVTPIRITEMPFWTRAHAKLIARKAFDAPKVKSGANCIACHRGAANGRFEDDD
jgi:hypothetical protein